MNEIEFYLNTHEKIKSAVYILDNNNNINPNSLKSTLSNSFIEDLAIVFNPNSINEDSEIFKFNMEGISISFYPSDNLADLPIGSTLLFDNYVNTSNILEFTRIKPSTILGSIVETNPSAFTIWETFRNISSSILVKAIRNSNLEPQVLKWERKSDEQIELSVVFPVYNVEKYLDQCLESVTTWDADYVEYIFVDDGSSDKSKDIISKWQKKDKRVKLLSKKNGGCASARQYGLESARGSYIGFVDPDDFIEPTMFCELLKAALTGSYEISYCGYIEYYENTGEFREVKDNLGWPYCNGCYNPKECIMLIHACRVAIWRGIYKKEMIERSGIHFYTDLRRYDDLPFKVETFAAAKSVIAVPKYMYYYRLERPGQDVSITDDRLFVHFDIFEHLNQSVAGTKDLRTIDCLQLCKVDTHIYALNKIQDDYFSEYIKKAKEDLNSTGRFFRTYRMVRKEKGRRKAIKYLAIMLKTKWLYRMAK